MEIIQKKKILLIDDIKESNVSKYIFDSYFHCETEIDPEGNKHMNKAYDLIFLSLDLDHADELELLEKIKTKGPNRTTPLIIYTGYMFDRSMPKEPMDTKKHKNLTLKHLLDSGASDFLEKPLTSPKLKRLFQKWNVLEKMRELKKVPLLTNTTLIEEHFLDEYGKVYVLEDTPRLTKTLSGASGVTAHYFNQSADLVHAFQANHRYVSLVVLDTRACMNWDSLIEKLNTISVIPSIFVIDESQNTENAVYAAKLKVAGYFYQPYEPSDILDAVEEHFEHPLFPQKMESIKSWISQNHLDPQIILERLFWVIAINSMNRRKDPASLINLFKGKSEETVSVDAFEHCVEETTSCEISKLAKGRILIVEDELVYLKRYKSILKREYEVTLCSGEAELMEVMEEKGSYDIVLLDVYLDGKDGQELYPVIKRRYLNCQVIVITAFDETDRAFKFIQQGAYEYINKPLSEMDLVRAVGRAWLCKLWPQLNEKINFHLLSFEKRVYFLDYIVTQRFNEFNDLNVNDIYALFPEILQKKHRFQDST